MCVPCAKKKQLNQDSLEVVKAGERVRKKVKGLVDRGKLTELQAGEILEPLMQADRAYIDMGALALGVAEGRLGSMSPD